MTTLIGLVANPKLKKPVLVVYEYDTDVNIYRFAKKENAGRGRMVSLEGEGSFEQDSYSHYYAAVRATGFPRAHTAGGVKTKGAGYGTALYTGLCLAAMQDADGEIRLGLDDEGAGISSQEGTRSPSADAWWRHAVHLGLADSATNNVEEDGVDITGDVDTDDLRNIDVNGKTITYVNDLNVDLVEYIEADYYTYQSAEQAGLILARFSAELEPEDLAELHEEAQSEELSIQDVNVDAMNALDVRGLPDAIVETMAQLMIWEGHGRDANMMRLKHVLNLDPDMGIHAAEKLMKKNARGAADTEQALMTTVNARRKLNWSKLAGLPG